MNSDEHGYSDSLTERVLAAIFKVSNTSARDSSRKSTGARLTELRRIFSDLLVEDVLVIELKCAERLSNEHTARCINYLRVSGRTLCLLVTFQKPKVEWKRIVQGFQIPWPMESKPNAG